MPHLLLTGAGFSRNWGGFLAIEAFEFLLGCPELNALIRNRLWANSGNFEETYQQLRDAAADPADLVAADNFARFNKMLIRMFDTMKLGFRSTHIERAQDRGVFAIDALLDHFDAIFTLNQDTLLEQHYIYNIPQTPPPHKWEARYIPGLMPPEPTTVHGNQLSKATVRSIMESGFVLEAGKQPYFKLHGSYNWRARDQHVMVIGGAKVDDINRIALLSWYQERFHEMICGSNTRLMIIGYSFNDDHINAQLAAAARAGAKMFIVDMQGLDVIDKRDVRMRAAIPPAPLFNTLRDNIVGASRRLLRPTLQSDPVEVKKYVDFLGIEIRYRYDE
ncbi:SIR2 family protein [Bradyrhizobium sp. SRL28]|uniref:SIR2 family protein n=1 Tax=Bradyrhizobium sp. SRL28 TaxID=2836178 RepID=UPI001BDEE252|nr:SIR2 family protein [Bradyrhizobium sp. SRL28]MBT1516248.1 SIR2 family protein [Bradyrhizobium sp. SRL28]